jgi:hypothetical protein
MKDPRRTRRTDAAKQLRAQRGAAAVMAQYVHDLSSRHDRFALRRQVARERAERTPVALAEGQ